MEQMNQEPLYNENHNFAHFLSCVNREMVGYKNLAAVSALIRYEVLCQYGGYYFDTDLEFLLDENSRFIPDELPLGIKLRTDLSFDLDKIINVRNTGRADTNNDLIIATPNHPILCRMIEQCLDVYQSLDNNQALEAPTTLTKMDRKRFPYSKPSSVYGKYQENRFNLTLDCGSALILRNAPDFVNDLALPATKENYKKVKSML